MAKYRIKGLPNNSFQKGGSNSKKDKWGRSADSKWYGFDPKTKEWTLGKRTVKKEVTVSPKKGSQTTADIKKYGKRDNWGRTPDSKWYGFDPKTKKWTLGEPAWKANETSNKVNEFVNQNILNPINWLMGEDPIKSLNAPIDKSSKQSKGKAYLDPYSGKKVYGNGPWNNYGDGPVQMVYPEKYVMGPRSAGEFIASLPSRSLRGLNAVNRAGLSDLIPGAVTRGMTLGEQTALKSRLAPFTVGNVLTAESIAKAGTEYIPNIIQGKDVTKNYLETIAALLPVSNFAKIKRVNDARNIYNLGKYGARNFADPFDAKDQYKFYRALGTLTGHRDGGAIPKAQLGAQTNPLYSGSNNLLIKEANKKAPKSLAKDVRPTIKKQIQDNEAAARKKAEADYIKAVATGQVSSLDKPAADAALANAELEREHARLQQQYYDDVYEQEQRKFEDKPLTNFSLLDFFDTGTKLGQFTRDLTADPLNVTEELIWDQDYLPNRSEILRNPSHPLYQYYMQRSNMGESPMSQALQYVNPFSSFAEGTVALKKGDYKDWALQGLEGLGKAGALAVAGEALPGVMGTTVALPEAIAAATGITGTSTIGGVLGAGFAGYGLTKLPATANKIAKAIETGTKDDWREAVNETGLNILDFLGTGEFLESTRPFAGALSRQEGTSALLNRAGELAREEEYLGEIARPFDRNMFREQLAQLEEENPFDWSTIDSDYGIDEAFQAQLSDDLAMIESEMQTLDMKIDDLFMNEQYWEPETFSRVLNEYQQERNALSETYDQLVGTAGTQDASLSQVSNFTPDELERAIFELQGELKFTDPNDLDTIWEIENKIEQLKSQRDNLTASGSQAPFEYHQAIRDYQNAIYGYDDVTNAAIDTYRNMDAEVQALRQQLFHTDPSDTETIRAIEQAINDYQVEKSASLNSITNRQMELVSNPSSRIVPSGNTSAVSTPTVTPTSPEDLNNIFRQNSELSTVGPANESTKFKPYNFSQSTLDQLNPTIVQRLQNTENPSQLLEALYGRFRNNRITEEAYNELVDALFHSLRQQGRSKDYIEDLKNIRTLMDTDINQLGETYSGSNKSLSELEDWYKNTPESELDQLDFVFEYGADDINAMYQRLDTDEARRALLNQVYDDRRYMINGERNPNVRPFNLRTQTIHADPFQPSEFANLNIPSEDVTFLKEITGSGQNMFTGAVNYNDVTAPVEKLRKLNVIQKTEDLEPLIEKYQKLYESLPAGEAKNKIMFFVEDLKSTKWLRTEYADELKASGLTPDEIEGASIISYNRGRGDASYATKMLVDKDGQVIGTLNVGQRKITMPDGQQIDVMDIGSTGVNYKFHPYQVGKGHSRFKNWTEAETYELENSLSPEYKDLAEDIVKAKSKEDLLKIEEKIYEKRLQTFPEEVREKPFIKAKAKSEVADQMTKINAAKDKAAVKIKQLQSNNNNRWGEALYRASHHGLKDTRGPIVTHEHFVYTDLADPVTGEIITRKRAHDYWYSQMKQFNEQGIPKAQHIFPGGKQPGNYIMIKRKRGGDINKLFRFIR